MSTGRTSALSGRIVEDTSEDFVSNDARDTATDAATLIREGRTALGIELGSTRIKACLVAAGDPSHVLAAGGFAWENRYENRLWTYPLDQVWTGLQTAFAALVADARERHGVAPTSFGALGVSAMMHGYLAFDESGSRSPSSGRGATRTRRMRPSSCRRRSA